MAAIGQMRTLKIDCFASGQLGWCTSPFDGMNAIRPVLASLVAPVAALLPLLVLAVYEINAPVVVINGEADDSPQKALGLMLVCLPVIYVVLALVVNASHRHERARAKL